LVEVAEEQYLAHYGIIMRSGRYPWGSGGNAHGFLADLNDLRKQGLSDTFIAESIGMTTTELRARTSIARAEKKAADVAMAEGLSKKGMSNNAIKDRMGLSSESSVRALLAPGATARGDKLFATAALLEKHLKEKTFVDVGAGVDSQLGISFEALNTALGYLEANGKITVNTVPVPQSATGLPTSMRVMCPHGTTQNEAWSRQSEIKQIFDHSPNDGMTFDLIQEPISVNPNRLAIRYDEDGGSTADGTIYVRPGAKQLSLGNAQYAQVRIKVGDTHYIKGMAVYKDDLPDGVDLMFNTNKKRSEKPNKLDVLKKLETDDPQLPFGSIVRQLLDKPGDPDAKVVSAMNIVNDEADWAKWSKTISAQMLAKQNPKLVREQLVMTQERRKAEFDEIMALNNPTVKKKLLIEFADSTDAAAVHLKAAQLDRSAWHVILPMDSAKPHEIYAPGYADGERVSLIRYPHGGAFEIPELVVNNKLREGRKIIGNDSRVAVGIHHTVAERLSGADFDGDTVLVIPNDKRTNKVKSKSALPELVGYDPKAEYPKYDGMKVMSNTQTEMGKISNLVTDMTILGANDREIARAVKHSMVVIDAEKHELNYKQSEIDNGIAALKQKYQGRVNENGRRSAGAATIISRAKGKEYVLDRKDQSYALGGPIDKRTGKKMYEPTNRTTINAKGERVLKRIRLKRLENTDDAHTLVSDAAMPVEKMYADHSNTLKAMANQARLESLKVPNQTRNPSAVKIYADQVATLDAKVKTYKDNQPRQRQADIVANKIVSERLRATPGLDRDVVKKIRTQAQRTARARTGTQRIDFDITDQEWEAIQAGAVSKEKLETILRRADPQKVRELATPKTRVLMDSGSTLRAKGMLAQGYSRNEVAAALGVSVSTLDRTINE